MAGRSSVTGKSNSEISQQELEQIEREWIACGQPSAESLQRILSAWRDKHRDDPDGGWDSLKRWFVDEQGGTE